MKGLFFILSAYLAGDLLAALSGGFLPGSVLGMILLFAALKARVVRPEEMAGVVNLLLDNMMLFFVPVGVGLMTTYSMIGGNIWAILVSLVVSTVLVIVVVGWVQQKAGALHPRRYLLVRRAGHSVDSWHRESEAGHRSRDGKNKEERA